MTVNQPSLLGLRPCHTHGPYGHTTARESKASSPAQKDSAGDGDGSKYTSTAGNIMVYLVSKWSAWGTWQVSQATFVIIKSF